MWLGQVHKRVGLANLRAEFARILSLTLKQGAQSWGTSLLHATQVCLVRSSCQACNCRCHRAVPWGLKALNFVLQHIFERFFGQLNPLYLLNLKQWLQFSARDLFRFWNRFWACLQGYLVASFIGKAGLITNFGLICHEYYVLGYF